MISGLAGKTALVTGGSQGIGKTIALGLAGEGVNVGLCARSREGLLKAAEEIRQATGVKVAIAQADCTDPQQVKQMVSTLIEELGGINILVNCVGRAKAGSFIDLTDDDWFQTINLKLMAAVRVTREVLPHMIRAKWGRIIMIGGVFGTQPSPFSIPMGVVNAGLFNFTKALAQDLVKHNILVNAVSPGRVDTPLFQQLVQRQAEQLKISPERAREDVLREVPIGRPAEPAEISNIVVFLASDLASYVNGEVVTVDGGWTKCV